MCQILNKIDPNDYGVQKMVGGGSQPNLQSKDVSISTNGTTTIEADQGYDGLSDVDVTVSGILDTSDANATASDIAKNKTAYVNGVKLTGNVNVYDTNNMQYSGLFRDGGTTIIDKYISGGCLTFFAKSRNNILIKEDSALIGISATNANIATTVGLTADKLKQGERVLGVTGTYEGEGGLNIYVQTSAPSTYKGIWIKSNSYSYSAVKEIASASSKEASTVNIVSGSTYSTEFGTNLTYDFDKVLITDSNNDVQYDIEVYYGDGTQWVDITPEAPLTGTFAGIRVDFVNGTVTELEGSSSVNNLTCYSGRRRCNMQNDGTITAYYGDNNYDNVGSEYLQVMVEQPKVYYALRNVEVTNGAIDKADYIVADTKLASDFELHPAFISNNVQYDNVYVGAFESTLANNKLSSIGGGTSKPLVNITRGTARTYASNRGNIWRQLTKQYEDLESLLMTIEFKSFNHQVAFSVGVTNSSSEQYVGQTYTLDANGTGLKGANISTIDCFTWRWRENKYGNVDKWLDGVNVSNADWYIKDNNFQDDTSTGYIQLSETANTSSGWITRFAYVENAKWIFMPKVVSSSQTGLIQDRMYYTSGGWRTFCTGGDRIGEQGAGSFYTDIYHPTNMTSNTRGCGLIAMPTPSQNS